MEGGNLPLRSPDSSYKLPEAPGEEDEEDGAAEVAVAELFSSVDGAAENEFPDWLVDGALVGRFVVDQGSGHDQLVGYFEGVAPKGLVAVPIGGARTGEILVAVPWSFKPKPPLSLSPNQRQPRGSVIAFDAMGQSLGKTILVVLMVWDAGVFADG